LQPEVPARSAGIFYARLLLEVLGDIHQVQLARSDLLTVELHGELVSRLEDDDHQLRRSVLARFDEAVLDCLEVLEAQVGDAPTSRRLVDMPLVEVDVVPDGLSLAPLDLLRLHELGEEGFRLLVHRLGGFLLGRAVADDDLLLAVG